MTGQKPKQFNPRVYAAAAAGWALIAGLAFGSAFHNAGSDVIRLWKDIMLGLTFALLSFVHLLRAWPALPKSYPWTRIGQSASSERRGTS
jgi:FtsH-binding integral membrane protein